MRTNEKNSKGINSGSPISHSQGFQKDAEHEDKNIIKETVQGNLPGRI